MYQWDQWLLPEVIIFQHQRDKIFAQRETITGSIGVIMQSINYGKLAENFGVEFETIKSGEHKDMFGGVRPSTKRNLRCCRK